MNNLNVFNCRIFIYFKDIFLVMTKDKLVITPKTARLTRDTDALGSMEPYCKLKYDGIKQKTKVDSSGGKTPNWNETFTFEVTA